MSKFKIVLEWDMGFNKCAKIVKNIESLGYEATIRSIGGNIIFTEKSRKNRDKKGC